MGEVTIRLPTVLAEMGRVALPEMQRYRYDDALATGSIAAGSCATCGCSVPA